MPLRLGIRDRLTRILTSHHELEREAWKLLTKDKSLPLQLRLKAQAGLNRFPRYMRPSSISHRCVEHGKGGGLIKDWKISRIVFRDMALAGELPGVKKSAW